MGYHCPSSRTMYPQRHRDRLGPGFAGDTPQILRLHRQQSAWKALQCGIHCSAGRTADSGGWSSPQSLTAFHSLYKRRQARPVSFFAFVCIRQHLSVRFILRKRIRFRVKFVFSSSKNNNQRSAFLFVHFTQCTWNWIKKSWENSHNPPWQFH